MKYKIALERTAEGYSVSVPGLPGCWSQGATEAEAVANIRDDRLRDADVREAEVVQDVPRLPGVNHPRCRARSSTFTSRSSAAAASC